MRISIVMEALTGKFETDIGRASKRTEREMKKIRQEAAKAGRAIAAGFAIAAAALVSVTKSSVAFADEIAKTARRIGISTDALQELRFAAEQSGVGMAEFEAALASMVKRQGDAVSGNKKFADGFERLGISVRELRDLAPEDLFNRIADGLQRLPDQAARISALDRVMEGAGRNIINAFGDGAESVSKFRREARELGVVLDEDLIRRSEGAADKMNILGKVLRVKVADAVLQNADSIDSLTDALIRFVEIAAEAPRLMKFIGEEFAATFSGAAIDDVVRLEDSIADALSMKSLPALSPSRLRFFGPEGVVQFYTNAELDAVIEEMKRRIEASRPTSLSIAAPDTGGGGEPAPSAEFLAIAAKLQEQIALHGQVGEAAKLAYEIQIGALDAMSSAEQQQVLALARRYDAMVLSAEAAKEAAAEAKKLQEERERALEAIRQTIVNLEQEVATLGMSERAAQLYRLGLEGATQAQIDHADSLLRTIEAHNEMQDLVADAASVFQATRTDLEIFNAEIERLNELRNTFVNGAPLIDEETYTRAVQAAKEALEGISQMDEFAKQAARNIQDIFADFIFDPFADGLSGMVSGFADAMRRMLAEAAAAALLKQLFGGLASSTNPFLSALGKQFGGAESRDSGGRGYPGQAYLIGTGAQPEMFIPDTAGTFVPASKQGGGTNIFQTIVQAPEGRITRESEGRLRARDSQRGAIMAGRNG